MQDIFPRFGLFHILISVLIGISSSHASIAFDNSTLDKALKDGALSVSRSEKRIANNLAKIYEIAEKGYINIKLTQKVLKDSRNYSAFKVYKDWLQSIIDVHSIKSTSSMRVTCSKIASKNEISKLKEELREKSTIMCFNQYLKLLSKKGSKLSVHKKDIVFFEKHASYITHDSNIESLNYFLSRYEKQGNLLKSYSETISNYYIDKKRTPPKSLLQYMVITPRLTKYIQETGLEESGAKYVLYSELSKLVTNAFNTADEKKSLKEINKEVSKVINYYNSTYEHLPKSKSDNRLLSLGKSLTRREHFKTARSLFEAITNHNPQDEDAIFESLWTWLTQEKYAKAYDKVITKHELHQNYKTIRDDRLQFWTAYTLKALDKSASREIFEDLISKSALNYYSILASKMLSEHYDIPSEKIYYKLANENAVDVKKMPKLGSEELFSIKRFKIWGAMDFKPLLNLESDHAYDLVTGKEDDKFGKKEKSAFLMLCAAALKEEENYLESFKMVYRGLSMKLVTLDKPVLEILFPKPYYRQVASNTKSFDPLIALSLIRQESGFNKRARSWVGARGLMQLMPATAKQYWRGIKTKHLYNPNINIKIGSKYLSMLLNKYDNNLVYALSAYNAGESRVKEWKREYLTHDSSILHNIENIPFNETRKYVKLIFRNLFFYKMMDREVEVADSNKVNQIFDVQLGFNQD